MNKICQVLFLKAAPSSSPPAVCITSLVPQLMPSSHLSLKWKSWTFAPLTSNSTQSEQQTCRKSNQLCGLSVFCFIDPLVLALRPSGMLPLQYCFSNITFHNWQFHFAAEAQQLVRIFLDKRDPNLLISICTRNNNQIPLWLVYGERALRPGLVPLSHSQMLILSMSRGAGGTFLQVGKSVHLQARIERERHSFTHVSVTTGNDILPLKGQSTASFLHQGVLPKNTFLPFNERWNK